MLEAGTVALLRASDESRGAAVSAIDDERIKNAIALHMHGILDGYVGSTMEWPPDRVTEAMQASFNAFAASLPAMTPGNVEIVTDGPLDAEGKRRNTPQSIASGDLNLGLRRRDTGKWITTPDELADALGVVL